MSSNWLWSNQGLESFREYSREIGCPWLHENARWGFSTIQNMVDALPRKDYKLGQVFFSHYLNEILKAADIPSGTGEQSVYLRSITLRMLTAIDDRLIQARSQVA